MKIRPATESEDPLLVAHYMALWESYGVPPEHYRDDAEACVRAFITDGRQRHDAAIFFAEEDGEVLGSAACQLHLSPYPQVIRPDIRRFGYVWSVYVRPEHRRRGIARALMQSAIAHLRAIGCTTLVLHSSDAGLSLYESLGFETAKEMRLTPVPAAPMPESTAFR